MESSIIFSYWIKIHGGETIANVTMRLDRTELTDDLAYDSDEVQSDILEYLRQKAIAHFDSLDLEFGVDNSVVELVSDLAEDIVANDFDKPEPQQVLFQDRWITVYS